MTDIVAQIDGWVEGNREECIRFLQDLISIPSPSNQEGDAARFLLEKMNEFNYTTARVDALNDAMGTIKGTGGGRSFLLNGHIDHVPVGDMVDPYSGKVMDGEELGDHGDVIYGRAACDMKAAVAAMVLAGRAMNELGIRLKGDYKVAAVALEEVGGTGTISTIIDSQFLADVVLIGEATDMQMALGHRGSMKFGVVVHGRACHASAPERGINALYKAMKMITKIKDELAPSTPVHPIYGKPSMTVTQITVRPEASNVVPEECKFWIDCRNHPGFTAKDLFHSLNGIIDELKADDPEFDATVIPTSLISGRTYSGFYTDPDEHPVVEEAVEAITESYKKPKKGIWTFATDGKMYAHMGIPVIGFGPGEEEYAHTQRDHVRVQDYLDTIKVYVGLACKICGVA
jgi:acetylornithine deacetylase/succinyl-diaminopimelate desuccinylase family protein